MNQILLGLSVPFLIGCLVYVMLRGRAPLGWLMGLPWLMLAGVLWAIAPDIPRVLGMNRLYNRLARDPRCDIFFWHYTIDQQETDSPWFVVAFLAVLLCLHAAAWRELYLAGKQEAHAHSGDSPPCT